MCIASHGFSSMSIGSRFVKIYNVLTFGSSEARLSNQRVQLGRFLLHRREAENIAKETGKEVELSSLWISGEPDKIFYTILVRDTVRNL